MLPAVEFDNQTSRQATEVDDEGTDGLLPPKFVTRKLAIA
jgi:hypothetical protein